MILCNPFIRSIETITDELGVLKQLVMNCTILRSVAQIIILNIGLYVFDYGLDITAYLYQRSKGHPNWAAGILLVTFLPNVVGFIYECTKTASLVETYARRKYEMSYNIKCDLKKHRIYHIYMFYGGGKWEMLTKKYKIMYALRLFLQYFLFSCVILSFSIPVVFLLAMFAVASIILKCLGIEIAQDVRDYLDRNLHGWIIGYHRLIDEKAQFKQQKSTNELLIDLLLKDR